MPQQNWYSVYWLFHSNPNGGGGSKSKREKGGGGGGWDMRAIIIISKSKQIKVVPLYSQVWSNKILRPCPFLSTAQEHRHRHKTQVFIYSPSSALISFPDIARLNASSRSVWMFTLTMRPFFTLARIFPFELHTDIVAECSLAFLNTW